ncbi:uncharacterized protein K452DRAFT_287299 [Aplosporella prunicola CBS 121167]|uniref:Uncharacterized protein n=1 Tax=Aplosporella prunicola CBS 121167 TaxID=1176127 RepID=A0A6A6BDG9_9PEZI|nr:uncharacterized protein K452DRAFT_287299 [Aplosporella prunicola CBS 121167]KAF2142096.1 hypothetical protein K452DRAFT_287299 [Aplosporella prunicola CBS 121167]
MSAAPSLYVQTCCAGLACWGGVQKAYRQGKRETRHTATSHWWVARELGEREVHDTLLALRGWCACLVSAYAARYPTSTAGCFRSHDECGSWLEWKKRK